MLETLHQLYKQADEILAGLSALLLAAYSLIGVMQGAMATLKKLALYTSTKEDDHFLEALSLRLARWHDLLARVQRRIPRLRPGKAVMPMVGVTIPPPSARPLTAAPPKQP